MNSSDEIQVYGDLIEFEGVPIGEIRTDVPATLLDRFESAMIEPSPADRKRHEAELEEAEDRNQELSEQETQEIILDFLGRTIDGVTIEDSLRALHAEGVSWAGEALRLAGAEIFDKARQIS